MYGFQARNATFTLYPAKAAPPPYRLITSQQETGSKKCTQRSLPYHANAVFLHTLPLCSLPHICALLHITGRIFFRTSCKTVRYLILRHCSPAPLKKPLLSPLLSPIFAPCFLISLEEYSSTHSANSPSPHAPALSAALLLSPRPLSHICTLPTPLEEYSAIEPVTTKIKKNTPGFQMYSRSNLYNARKEVLLSV